MTKKETLWREILDQTLTKHVSQFTQKALAAQFHVSLSTVFNALAIPRKIGAVEVTGRFFRVRDPEKFLLLWATHRNLKKDTVYATHSDLAVQNIEASMPHDVIFGAFSAFRFAHHDAPADYSVVYVYASDLARLQNIFPKQKGYHNIIALKPDPFLAAFGSTTPDVQTFVDLWNIPEWYAKDFLDALKRMLIPS